MEDVVTMMEKTVKEVLKWKVEQDSFRETVVKVTKGKY
jgi:hypothetical protein